MPNWVRNEIEVYGNEKDMQRFLKKIKSKDSDFDFNKIIPMPKSLDVSAGSSNSEDIYWYLSEKGTLSIDDVRKNPLSRLINGRLIGDSYINSVAESVAEKENKPSYEMGKQLCDNYTKYGSTTWYDWRVDKWGTKWNASEPYVSDYGTGVYITFDTAWSMPDGILKKLCKKFPNLKMNGKFADEDIGNNCGEWWNDNGNFEIDYVDTVEFACDVWGYDPDEYDY